ncbi:hydrocephalus-inducing protein homolog isoform X11 [Mercenaria mercenaria]|uniref:hydrocephalus-inducing protein homolog isoform X11 n=1 Tax=Mercenaria mercenaria TaxID=6596 RepID=UPI00234F4107|nr:hydrocephalus-inducing protein homolog isoform X11 [Mercenaria mercenaria]
MSASRRRLHKSSSRMSASSMPLGPFGEVVGTTGTLEALGIDGNAYKSKVIAPRNPKLLKQGEDEGFKMTPSKYMFDMQMNTEQKLANTHTMKVPRKIELLDMADTSLQKRWSLCYGEPAESVIALFSQVNIDEPMFQPFPSEIYFQKFEPFETYEVPLVLRNNDRVPRLVKVTQADSPYFKIISPHDVGHKVGPGLPTTFRLQFTPDEIKDYMHELVCITEREKFIVPVRAIGARAVLDFPDEINFPIGPVKYSNTKTLLIRNIGNREAKFTMKCEKPFSVSPEIGTLAVNDSMQVTVEFIPDKVGDHKQVLVVHYDSGEDINISLYGAAQDANVRLDKNSLRIENTFISMANQRTVTISNRTDVLARFRWTQFATKEEEDQQKYKITASLEEEEKTDSDRFLEECIQDPTLRDKLSILGRTFKNRKQLIQNDEMLFNDDVVKIEPSEGDIWPNSSVEVNIIFKPREAKSYSRTAFCDVTGRESRLPLRIKGDGIGPKVQFSIETLDMGNIFIGSKHYYEIVMANKGDIDAIYSVIPNQSVFGPCFQFNPAEGIVMPGGHQAIQVSFKSPYLGDFEEEFSFQVDGQPDLLKVLFTGSVIGPTFQFDVPRLKFGSVSFGFLNTKSCTLTNTSLVPMKFHLRVPGDGVTDSVCGTSDLDSARSEMASPSLALGAGPPREFEIIPSSGSIPPQSEIKVTVNFISNTIKKYEMNLVVDVDSVGEEIVSLPITAKCVVPLITVLSPILDYGRCFLRHPYEHSIKLHNDSDLPAKYELVQQVIAMDTPITYKSPQPKGIVDPHSVLDVPLIIEAQALEEQDVVAHVSIFGSPDPPMPVHIACIGEGPVVHVMPLDLDWNVIPVLQDKPKKILLSNESLIPARFTAHMVRPKSVYRVEPADGEIPPEKSIEITVAACPDDCVRFHDKLQINFLESQVRQIPLVCYGQGTTIVSDPPLTPHLDLGPNFSNRPYCKVFHLTNKGRRHQQLVWSMDGFSPIAKAKKEMQNYNPLDMKFRNQPPPAPPASPVFKVTPNRFDLPPGTSIDLKLEGFVASPQFVKERLLCHAIIGRQGGKELIMKIDVSSDFISPLLEFSTKSVYFRVDKQPEDTLEVQTRELVISNVSSLPLTTALKLNQPFQILLEDGSEVSETEVHLEVGKTYTLKIRFDPAYKEDLHIRTIDEVLHITYKEHPHIDYIALRGEVYFPNLEFEKSVMDFGCILNDTEVTRYVNITNNSPMVVKYRWSFLIGDEENKPVTVINHPVKPPSPVIEEVVVEEEEEIQQEATPPPVEVEQQVEVIIQEATEIKDEETEKSEVEPTKEEGEIIDTTGTLSPVKSPETTKEADDNKSVDQKTGTPNVSEMPSEDVPEKGQLEQEGTYEDESKKAEGADTTGMRLSLDSLDGEDFDEDPLKTNRALAALLESERGQEATPLGVEEVFDILPLYGTLEPGDTEQVTMTFYGHADIWGQAKAICEVEGGPTYELTLKGEASLVSYRFDCKEIHYGKQMYDHVATTEITLVNTGKVGFEFCCLNLDPALAKKPKPGVPIMVPHAGYIEPMSEQKLTIKYLPGVPEKFNKCFRVQVAHFEPDLITIHGEGVFPRISLDLPRVSDDKYTTLVKQAKENVYKRTMESFDPKGSPSISHPLGQHLATENLLVAQSQGTHQDLMKKRLETSDKKKGELCVMPSELDVQLEVERLAVRNVAHEIQQQEFAVHESYDTEPPNSIESRETQTTADSKGGRKKKNKPRLPEYLLDFGYVVLGTVRTHIVKATNTGYFPASFQVERNDFHHHGFHVELDRVRNLPGSPDYESVDFVVSFDPRGANLPLGPVESFVPVNILNGPMVMMHLKANVTMPDMQISDDTLDFGEVRCGECRVVIVQLHNYQHVKCDWNSLPSEKDRNKRSNFILGKGDKHVPMHLRRKSKADKSKPRHFEIMPPTGTLMPGQRLNVQVKFMPSEEKFYEQRIPIRIAQSSQRILLLCRGQGSEPRLDFDLNMMQFGPILPHSVGDEKEVIVKNPCAFPIEVYNLEFDSQYLEEEKMLRLMKGYDEYNTILLPPRPPGEKLPPELLEYYEEQMLKLEESEKARREAEEQEESARREAEDRDREENGEEGKDKEDGSDKTDVAHTQDGTITARSRAESLADTTNGLDDAKSKHESEDGKDTSSSVGVGEMEITPVSKAVARHLGIDLSDEGKAARNRRGIACIVNGAPLSGKTATAITLAKQYEAALLSIDNVVLDAISNGNTSSGLKAREMCAEAARKRMEEIRALEGDDGEKKVAGGLSVEAVAAHTQGATGGVNVSAAHSMVSNRKTSTITDVKGLKDKHGSVLGGKTNINTSSIEGGTGSQVPSSPPPLAAPIARRLSVSASVAGEEGLMSCVLPEELLVEILAERLQLNDCHRGVVFDGLETLFAQNQHTAASAVLKALNNRRFIYFITLKLDYNHLKEQEKKDKEEKERQDREREEEERRRLEEMSEDEYDALTEKEKAEVDRKRLEIKKERIRKIYGSATSYRRKEKEAKEEEERLRREKEEEEQRLREEERKGKKGKKAAKDVKDDPGKDGKKSQAAGKGVSASQEKVKIGGKHDIDHTVSKTGSNTERPESHQTEKSDSQTAADADKKGKKGKDGKEKGKGEKGKDGEAGPAEEVPRDPIKEAELLLMQRFRTFEVSQKEITELVEYWDRLTLGLKRPRTPSERSDEDGQHQHPPSGKKGKGKADISSDVLREKVNRRYSLQPQSTEDLSTSSMGHRRRHSEYDKHDKEKAEKERQKQIEKENAERLAREAAEAAKAAAAAQAAEGEDGETVDGSQEKEEDVIGVPHIIIDVHERSATPSQKVLTSGRLPTVEEVLDGLGLGPKGPPIPPPANFSVVPYPVKRRAPGVSEFGGRYVFIASSPDDPNIGMIETKESEQEEEKSVTPDKGKDDHPTPTKGKGGKDKKEDSKKDAGKDKERKKSAERKTTSKGSRRNSIVPPSPPPGQTTPISDGDALSTVGDLSSLTENKTAKLTIFRWIIPAHGDITLRLRFQSEELGQFDQTLNFEIVGTRRRYQLYCRGICAFPTISREPRIVFAHRKKSKKLDEIVHKKYILTSETFEFGPLLVGRNRDRYKEGRFPEHMETLTIKNTSPLDADISFCYLHDSKGETFLLDPPTMMLKPGDQSDLNIWAYPMVPNHYEDSIVCCIRENPEPVVFKVCCDAFRPELDLDRKQLHFDRVLLHRKDTKTIYLRNSTQIPVHWKLSGLDMLGEDFTVAADSGIVEPKSEYALNAYFRAMKPVNSMKKMIRLEISDAEETMGVIRTEPIQVIAEAYDVAVDIAFPKGTDGGLDFSTIKVMDEVKQTCTLKNKGKYDIQFNFLFENCDPSNPNVTSLFSVIPSKGVLCPQDRQTAVQVIFKSNKEVTVKDQPILKCQVIEPNIAEEGELIASIPVKVSVKAVFNKYNILPMSDINFGSLLVNSKKTRTFIIENKGEFDFKYQISKMVKEPAQQPGARSTRPSEASSYSRLMPLRGTSKMIDSYAHIPGMQDWNRVPVKGDKRTKSRDGSSSGRSVAKPKKTDSTSEQSPSVIQKPSMIGTPGKFGRDQPNAGINSAMRGKFNMFQPNRQEMGGQSKLQLGAFTIFPAFGIILPNGHQTITVDCVAESQGRFDEELSIDIADRDPTDHPGGISYKLLAEACIPSINVDDLGAIFEEHRVCKNLSVWQHSNSLESSGVYAEDEKKFVFNNVIVGRKAVARFKISNNQKVPCDVVFTVKPLGAKSRQQDIFEVEPARAQIMNHSYVYATVTFTPPSMQSFSALFEAVIDGLSPNQARGKTLTFEVAGDGNLPRISITKPTVRNKRGQPLLLFKKNLVGRTESLPLVLLNDGTLPSKVDIDLIDPDRVFKLVPAADTNAIMADDDDEDASRRPHTASVNVNVGETVAFKVNFCPTTIQRSQAHVRVSVIDNQYEDSVIQLVGEGYEDEISLDKINSVDVPIDPESEEGNMAEDDVSAAKPNLIRFGDCFINEPRTLSFSMTNHSKTDAIRFQWPDHPQLKFSPTVGHLHTNSSKDFTVTFKSDQPKTLQESAVPCKVTKITFSKQGQMADWDDRIRTVKWVDVPSSPAEGSTAGTKTATTATPRPAKRKVVETEPEPPHTEVADSARNVELLVSAVAEYSKYKCKLDSINFRETLMFQTRVYEFTMSNKGSVQLDYSWQVVMENFTPTIQRAVTFISEGDRPESRVDVVDTQYIPFTIEPEYGTIMAGKKQTFSLKFTPLDANDYEGRLVCTIPNLEKNSQGPVLGIKGKSLMPYCHFELEDSDYITNARRNPEMRGPGGAPPGTTLDPNTRVIEFETTGVSVKCTKSFGIVNPTSQVYSYQWICEDEVDPKKPSAFLCVQPKGQIRSGKKATVTFEYSATQLDIMESFWRFTIPEQNINIPFLLVGQAKEPDIIMDRSHMNFKALLIGHEAKETVWLINNENQSFHFNFDEDSTHSAGYSAHLFVEPMAGQLPPKSKIPVDLYFTPNSDKEVNFNLTCNVRRKTLPVTLNVKAEGYSMDCTLLCEDSLGNRVELSPDGLSQINFGEVEVNEQQIRNLFILNSGKFNFDFNWELNMATKRKDMVSMTPMSGGVNHGERKKCILSFCPSSRMTLRDSELALKISHGPSFHIALNGLGVSPGLHFSFLTANFGSCFIYRAGMPSHTKVLKLTNKDKKEISVDCLYTPTNHLHHTFEACVIQPGQSVDVAFTFYPREAKKYKEIVTFEINGLSKQDIEIMGQGTEMKIEVADPKHKMLNLGAQVVGKVVKRYIPIINNSPAAITFTLALTPTTPALQQPGVLSISPTHQITLEGKGGTCKVEVIFKPTGRIPQFMEEVLLECAGLSQPLFVMQGSCLGMEISLDTVAIPFGAVVQRSQTSRKIVMANTGDMNAKFCWDINSFKPDFSIYPVEGYITPGMEVTFEVFFHPQEINQDIRYDKLRCFLEGGPHKPVTLTLTGTCIGNPPVREGQHFSTNVRVKDTKNLTIPNRSNQTWHLKPIIEGEQWSGPVSFVVEPQQTKQYELTYFPLTMTSEGKKHQGSIFFPLPDGTGLMFNLVGTAEAPRPSGKVQRDIPSKTWYNEMLPVQNWLKKPQRFRVKVEPMRQEKFDTGTQIKSMDYIDVPASSKKDYKLSFYAYKESITSMKVTFINEPSGEYQYYEVTFKATRPGVISTIDLVTPVRQSVHHKIKLDNPLPQAVIFTASCNVPEVLMPSTLNVPPNSSADFTLEYQPLRVGESTARLEFSNNELGFYYYDLNLKATSAGPERALYFRTCLGQSQVQVAKFLNFAKQKTDYTCKVDNGDFHVDKTVAAAPGSTGGTEVGLDVSFEPSRLGEQRALLVVSSPVGGEYSFPLFGTCIAPKPQGPFIIKSGSTTTITFRNVFSSTTAFTFQVDNPMFHLVKTSENIRSRKDHRISVGFDGNDVGSKAAVMGKLIVTCPRSAGGNSNVQWVYYLKGVTQ